MNNIVQVPRWKTYHGKFRETSHTDVLRSVNRIHKVKFVESLRAVTVVIGKFSQELVHV